MEPIVRAPARRWSVGLAPKLVAVVGVVMALVSVVMSARAGSVLEENLSAAFASKGEAIALTIAKVVERSPDRRMSVAQAAIDANKAMRGVAYIYLANASGQPELHTFGQTFPEALKGRNNLSKGELSEGEHVKVNAVSLALDGPDGRRVVEVLDIAALTANGVVHVGMDQTEVFDRVRSLWADMLGLGLVVCAIGVLSALALLVYLVIRPIRELTRVTSDIVEKGDLTQTITVTSDDEIGHLARTFSEMVARLRQIPTSLQESTSLLASAVAHLNRSTSEQSQTLTRQAAALQETQVTAQQIKQTSLLASQKAEHVLQVAERADAISRAGESAIEQSLNGMSDIRQRVDEISQKISQLSDRTLQIGGITQTVKDLADQSNMLALNAAIEAVRSGEHGKGFAVVAKEIRSLADQSIKATDRVREILDDISGAIQGAVIITESGSSRMEAGLVQMRNSGENLRELSSIVKDNSAAVRQIAAAVNQQNAGITQIFTAVTDLSKMMDESMSRLGSTTDAAASLREVSERVAQMVKSYRI